VAAPDDDGNPNGRIRNNGDAEYGGIIQVTDLGALESWINGKLEFRYRVFIASGTNVKNRAFGKYARSNFRDQKWKDFGDFLFYWNTANIGNFTIEGWIEEDGGNSTNTISQTFPSTCTGCPATTISYTKQSSDQDLGPTIVQFTDPTETVYNISYANIKRRD